MSNRDVLIGFMIAYLALITIEAIRRRALRVFGVSLGIGILIYVLIAFFLSESSRGLLPFGEESLSRSQLWTLLTIVAGAVMGIAARYVFELDRPMAFSWFSMLKPLCISPIVVFPLMATTQGGETIAPFKMAMFWLLAFQNGFFWQVILDKVKTRIGGE